MANVSSYDSSAIRSSSSNLPSEMYCSLPFNTVAVTSDPSITLTLLKFFVHDFISEMIGVCTDNDRFSCLDGMDSCWQEIGHGLSDSCRYFCNNFGLSGQCIPNCIHESELRFPSFKIRIRFFQLSCFLLIVNRIHRMFKVISLRQSTYFDKGFREKMNSPCLFFSSAPFSVLRRKVSKDLISTETIYGEEDSAYLLVMYAIYPCK